jgi:hypothetical protein
MGIRTPDLLHAMQALYQLSYSPWMDRTTSQTPVASATPVYKKLAHTRHVAAVRRAGDLATIERTRTAPDHSSVSVLSS